MLNLGSEFSFELNKVGVVSNVRLVSMIWFVGF